MPDQRDWVIEKLQKRHDRAAFACGNADLDNYFRQFAGQNERAGITQHFVAVERGASRVLGYYGLSAGGVDFTVIPESLRKRLPRYPVPVAHIGRLAVDQSSQGRGLGEDLLIDACRRVVGVADQIGIHAIEVVAISGPARSFYLKYGFSPLLDDEMHLYLPLSVVRTLLAAPPKGA